jgi:FG-GAP repeat/IPT/TIG domain
MELGPVSPQQAMDRSGPRASTRPRVSPAAARRRMALQAAVLAVLVGAAVALPSLRGGAPRGAHAASSAAQPGASVPAAAWARISATLGAQRPAYRIEGGSGALRASNPAQGVSASFTGAGIALRAASLDLRLGLRTIGRSGEQIDLGPVAPSASANRVRYARSSVAEWYANGPLGIEQGFTIPRRVGARGPGPLTLTTGVSSDARATLARGGRAVTFSHGGTSLRYGGLVATDATGRLLHSWLALAGGKLLLRVDDAHARYPLTIDPLIQTGGKLTPNAGEQAAPSLLGASVALSGDGSTILVGAPRDNGGLGAAWVFVRSGASWVQQGSKLTSGEPSSGVEQEECDEEGLEEVGECAFGASVALSEDGNTALVGAPSGTQAPGAAWVFTRSGGTWEKQKMLTGGDGGRFGRSVALSGDGDTALVGDPSGGLHRGEALVFTRSGSTWTAQQPPLTPSASEHIGQVHFGRSVALSGDGDTALVGAPAYSEYSGAAWSFARSGSAWTQASKLTAEGGEAHFGRSVALSGDGDTALVGGPSADENRGAAWVFTGSASSFEQPGRELAPTAEGELGATVEAGKGRFGTSVALSGGGTRALVGAPREDGLHGEVTGYALTGGVWVSEVPLAGSEATSWAGSGTSVALSDNGETAAIGAPHNEAQAGGAWAFAFVPPTLLPPPQVTGVAPGHGPASGGTLVRIRGKDFERTREQEPVVMFGAEPASSVRLLTKELIQAVSPPGAEGQVVDVTVQTLTGNSEPTKEDKFRYEGSSQGGSEPEKPGGKGGSGSSSSTSSSGSGTPAADPASGGVLGAAGAGAAACKVSLSSKRITVSRYRSAAVRLVRTGAGQCRGTLTLRYRQKTKGKHYKLRMIGSARFSIAPGKSLVVKVALNKLGRKLFRSGHGKLNASAAVVRTMPTPTLARSASVRLSVQKARKRSAAKK